MTGPDPALEAALDARRRRRERDARLYRWINHAFFGLLVVALMGGFWKMALLLAPAFGITP